MRASKQQQQQQQQQQQASSWWWWWCLFLVVLLLGCVRYRAYRFTKHRNHNNNKIFSYPYYTIV
eukprot:scaffold1221_cov207-Amphora_coffeaeformis.AAC.51